MLTSELNIIRTNLAVYFARLSNKVIGYPIRFGTEVCCKEKEMFLELLMYQWVLSTWQQYEDGTLVPDSNYITADEFNIMINRTKLLIETS